MNDESANRSGSGAERWNRVDQLLEQALERETDGRAAFLEKACGGDAKLQAEVEELLVAHDKAGSFLASPAVEVAAKGMAKDKAGSLVGWRLGPYEVQALLGAGGMGEVYRARDTRLDRTVAIKILPSEFASDEERMRRFGREAKAASALNHPNVATIYDVGDADGIQFIVMEYVEGKTLDALIGRKGMRLNDALKYGVQIADALATAHETGIVHRDLKPGNLMVTGKGQVKVLDFGLAKLRERVSFGHEESTATVQPTTEEGKIVGTVAYMSPEQAEGKKVDARSDIFSLGSVLYEMATGQRAFEGDSKLSTLSAILHQEPKPVSAITRAIPADLEKLIKRCLRKDPARRFQHMDDVKIALEEMKEDSDPGRLQVAPAAARHASPLRLALIVVVLVVMIAAGWYWLNRQRPAEPETPMTATPLTTYPGWERTPSFSPDGTQVAFQWCKEEPRTNCNIYIKQIGMDPPSQLTSDPAEDFSPAWSPDGRFIAFLRRLSRTRCALILIPHRGGKEWVLGESELGLRGIEGPPPYVAWTPDSKAVVLPWEEAGKAERGLCLISLETEERRRLTDNAGDNIPALSPDGSILAFTREHGAGADLYLLRLGEGYKPKDEPEKIPSGNAYIIGVAWTPDGRDIVTCDGSPSSRGLSRIAALMSGKPVRLAFGSGAISVPAISRNGNRLAYAVGMNDSDIYRVDLGGPGLNPGVPYKFISSTKREVRPTYSPDGKKIAFHSDRSGAWEVWVCDRDGLNVVQLTSLGGDDWDGSAWSPDGRSIAFGLEVAGSLHIFVVNASTGVSRSLAIDKSGASMFHPCWSRDAHAIYFRSGRSGASEIWRMPATGGDAVQITHNTADLPQVSPDGRFLYYSKTDRYPEECSVWRMPVGGGEESVVLRSTACHPAYAVSEQGIYFFAPRDKQGRKDLNLYDIQTGKTRKILTLEHPFLTMYMAVSPDGRTILYTGTVQAGSDLMLVKNFR